MTPAKQSQLAQPRREHPRLFSAPMVRKLLDGSKTQTRRTVSFSNSLVNGWPPCRNKPGVLESWEVLDFSKAWVDGGPSPAGNPGPYLKVPGGDESVHRVYSRVEPGDLIWVKETFCACRHKEKRPACVWYRADDEHDSERPTWKPSIFMPRALSRITLEVTALRVERLQDISEADAIAEGVSLGEQPATINGESGSVWFFDPRRAYAAAWQSINRHRAPWKSNPWVWVLEFRREP